VTARARPWPPPSSGGRDGGLARRPPSSFRRRARWGVEPRYLVLGGCALAVAYLALVPVGTMFVAAFQSHFLTGGPSHWTLSNFASTFTSAGFGKVIANSFLYAGATAVASTPVGFGLAWIVARTNTPARALVSVAAITPLVIPGILNTVAWALLFAPQVGPLNELLASVGLPTFTIYSLAGMVFVQSIHVVPIPFLLGVATLRSMDGSLEEAAAASGARPARVFATITIPLARPAILAAGLLTFVQTISSFEVPQLIGVPGHIFVFVSEIYAALQAFPTGFGSVGVIGVFVLAIAATGLVLSARLGLGTATQTLTGKGFRPRTTDLGRWRWVPLVVGAAFCLLTVILPLAMLAWSSVLPAYRPPSFAALRSVTLSNYRAVWTTPTLIGSVEHSVVTAVAAGAIVTVLSAVVAYITVKTNVRGRSLLDGLATFPIAVPSVIMGVGVLYWYLVAPLPFHLYGTLAILVIAFVTIGLPYGVRYLTPGMARVSDELEEAASASGAGWLATFRRIYLPLLAPSLLAAFLYTVIIAFREVSAAIFLYSSGTEVMSVMIYNLWSDGSYPVVAALGVVMVAFLAAAVALIWLLGGRIQIARLAGKG
jgi:iron(III) transport system permease protein